MGHSSFGPNPAVIGALALHSECQQAGGAAFWGAFMVMWRRGAIHALNAMSAWVVATMCLCCQGAFAQADTCEQIGAMARMARAISVPAVMAEQQNTGNGYRANTVFAARMFVLLPTDITAAERLLSLMPSNNEESIVWGNFGLAFCQQEPESDMTTLAKLGAQLPSLLASAVLIKPAEMPRYVKYALLAVGDPDNDHTVQMERICRMKRHEFLLAVDKLDPDERKWFDSRIFDVKKCKAIHVPENDDE